MDTKTKTGNTTVTGLKSTNRANYRAWSIKFGVLPEGLKRAVKATGTFTNDIE